MGDLVSSQQGVGSVEGKPTDEADDEREVRVGHSTKEAG